MKSWISAPTPPTVGDYPDTIAPAARAVANGECERGIVLCTTGIGASIAANKVKGVRCALLSDVLSARMTRLHNDTNVMALGAGIVGKNLAMEIVTMSGATPSFPMTHGISAASSKLTALEG